MDPASRAAAARIATEMFYVSGGPSNASSGNISNCAVPFSAAAHPRFLLRIGAYELFDR